MIRYRHGLANWLALVFISGPLFAAPLTISPKQAKPQPITMAELAQTQTEGVSVREVSDYGYGGYQGDFPSPPHADLNPKKTFILLWKDFPFHFVFAHEGSYCPWFELPSGAAGCFQFLAGNNGWAELFNQWGRQARNSLVDIVESGPRRVWARWTYFGVNLAAGQRAYRATEDFLAYPNGLILWRQTYESLIPQGQKGYALEPIELIGLCPAVKHWVELLETLPGTGERHALAVLGAFTDHRYDVFWKLKPGTLWDSAHRRSGADWQALDDAAGAAFILPPAEGWPFCVFGDDMSYRHDYKAIQQVARQRLQKGEAGIWSVDDVAGLPATWSLLTKTK